MTAPHGFKLGDAVIIQHGIHKECEGIIVTITADPQRIGPALMQIKLYATGRIVDVRANHLRAARL